MAKRTPWESKQPSENRRAAAKEKDAPAQAPEKAPPVVVVPEVEPVKAEVVPPAPPVAKVVKKKARYVRERKKKEAGTSTEKAAPRSKTAAEKTMSKNLAVPVDRDEVQGPKFGPKRKP